MQPLHGGDRMTYDTGLHFLGLDFPQRPQKQDLDDSVLITVSVYYDVRNPMDRDGFMR